MGSLFSKPKIPAPPPPPAPTTVRDEIGGVEQVPVLNADGTYTYVTRRLPLTAEQQARQNEFNTLRDNALAEIKRLTSANYQNDEATQAVITDWESQQKSLLDRSFRERQQREEQELARRGLGDSTVALNIRRQRELDNQDSMQQLVRERRSIADSVRDQKLQLQNNLFQLANQQQDLEASKTLQAGISSQGLATAVNETNNASLRDYYARQVTAAQSRGPSLFSNVLSLASAPLSGTLGGGLATGFIGSIFAQRRR